MPVTARLSKKFYDTLGEDATNELVDWLNTMDSTCRDLRELNELSFARFDAKLDQGMSDLRRELAELKAELVRWMFAFWAPTALGVIGTALVLIVRR